MNPLIKNRLPADYLMLWELTKKQRLSGDLGNMIQNQIKQVRKNFRNTKVCPLYKKHLDYGNEGMWSAHKLRELSVAIYENKRPGNLGIGEWISIEIELVMPSEAAETELLKFIRKNGFSDRITIKNDGSIRTISPQRISADEQRRRDQAEREGLFGRQTPASSFTQEQNETRTAFGREIIMTFRFGDWRFVKDVCAKLNSLKCFVNTSCGLHVHFDCRHLDVDDVVRVGKRVASTIPALKQLLPASRQENRFCATDLNDINGAENRYSFVNLQSYHRHQTIEIRGHSGTTDAVKIVNWIRILKKIMDKRSRKPIVTVAEMINSFQFEDDLVKYANARYEKFHSTAEVPAEMRHLDDVEVDDSSMVPAPSEIMEATPPPLAQSTAAPTVDANGNPIEDLLDYVSSRLDRETASTARRIMMAPDMHMPVREAADAYSRYYQAPVPRRRSDASDEDEE